MHTHGTLVSLTVEQAATAPTRSSFEMTAAECHRGGLPSSLTSAHATMLCRPHESLVETVAGPSNRSHAFTWKALKLVSAMSEYSSLVKLCVTAQRLVLQSS